MPRNNLSAGRRDKKVEFYTRYEDIEREMNNYYEYDNKVFEDKTILLPCDDHDWSNFTKYFVANFERYKIKRLISTSYAKSSGSEKPSDFEKQSELFDEAKDKEHGKIFILERDENGKKKDFQFAGYLKGDGDFRSDEVKELRDISDIIITNPPFATLFREFISWIMEANKKFIIVGNQNAITYKEFFPLIKENKVWLGGGFPGNVGFFKSPYEDTAVSSQHKEGLIRVSGVMWFTNIDLQRKHTRLTLSTMKDNLKHNKRFKKKIEEMGLTDYPKYDNYDAIDVCETSAIPSDYDGVMGVPITFLTKYSDEQFEIIDINPHFFTLVAEGKEKPKQLTMKKLGVKKDPYARILIKSKKTGEYE